MKPTNDFQETQQELCEMFLQEIESLNYVN